MLGEQFDPSSLTVTTPRRPPQREDRLSFSVNQELHREVLLSLKRVVLFSQNSLPVVLYRSFVAPYFVFFKRSVSHVG